MKRYQLLLLVVGFIGAAYVGNANAANYVCERSFNGGEPAIYSMSVKQLSNNAVLLQREGFDPFIVHQKSESNPFVFVASDESEYFITADKVSYLSDIVSENCYEIVK